MTTDRSPRGGVARRVAVTCSVGITALVATLTWRRVWPRRRRLANTHPPLRALPGPASTDGDGITIVVNSKAGPAFSPAITDDLRSKWPAAMVVEMDEGTDLVGTLEASTGISAALGVAGGDGSVNAAAGIAYTAGLPLVVVPGGTLNHFARDAGLASVDDAVEAVRTGHVVAVDLGMIDGRPFLNTAAFGSYPELVEARERLERRIGKWPAMIIALAQVLRGGEPIEVEIAGVERRLWMAFIGNCCYQPVGFAPTWRPRLDDGLFDVRLVSAERRWARVQLVFAVLSGRLGRCPVYEAFTTEELHIRSASGQLLLACDGETFEGSAEFDVVKAERPLGVYAPRTR